MKTIVVSAVNLVEGGTLTILKECLAYLSTLAQGGGGKHYRIIAIVYDKNLAYYPNIDYIETSWPKKRWINRCWFEYVSLNKISKQIGEIDLWLSLHDTTPRVQARRQAVYCHNSFMFYKWKMHDWLFAPTIAAFALLTKKAIYRPNIYRNDYLVVQQEWFRQGLSCAFSFSKDKIIVAPPELQQQLPSVSCDIDPAEPFTFIYAASPNSHKNFECICRAVQIIEQNHPDREFKVEITVQGTENKYAQWLYRHWGAGKCKNLHFIGFQQRDHLLERYERSHCLIFPSKIETWGLPISEFSALHRPMLLADLPYAHETAAGAAQVAYFSPDNAEQLASMMTKLIQKNYSFLFKQPAIHYQSPVAQNWAELFQKLLQ